MTPPVRCLLVSMPWASVDRPSLALGTLVAVGKAARHHVRAWEPTLELAAALGPELYQLFAETPSLFGLAEHLFACDTFGASDLDSDQFLAQIGQRLPEGSRARLEQLRDQDIPRFLDACVARVLELGADVVGFSCTFNQLAPSLALARRLKLQWPELRILFGGGSVHGEMGRELARAFPDWVDHVFLGEADESFGAALDCLALHGDIVSIAGVTAHDVVVADAPPVQNMDAIPVPDYRHYFAARADWSSEYDLPPVSALPFESSRGCWWGERSHCTFCGLNGIGMQYRQKSTTRVIEDLEDLVRRHGITRFTAADNILPTSAYRDLLPAIAASGLDLELFYEIKSNAKRDDVAALRDAGVAWVQPGIESFSDAVLRKMSKGVDALRNLRLLRLCAEFEVVPSYNILCGFAEESDADYAVMLDLLERAHHLPPPSGSSTRAEVHRFSPFHNAPADHGIQGVRPARYYSHLFPAGRVELTRLAYFFDHDVPDDDAYSRNRAALDEALARWRSARVRRTARLGPGTVTVLESREGHDATTEWMGLEALVFVMADDVESTPGLVRKLNGAYKEEEVEGAIASLIRAGHVVRVGSRILHVVPLQRPRRSSELAQWTVRWNARMAEGQEWRLDGLAGQRTRGASSWALASASDP
jgi:ribosomal peptide maturation radical SAM protein 1